jgi:hypothetical protein
MVMGLEAATYIGQLVATNPLAGDPVSQGDDHLKLIKSVLQSQFTSLGNAAVVRTAAELNLVNQKLTSFNGRSTPAAVPQANDYSADMLSDVTITTPVLGNVLMNNGAGQWVNVRGPAVLVTGCFLYDGYAGQVTDSIWFSNARRQTVPASVATVKNDGTGAIGWTLTAVAACLVTLHAQFQQNGSGNAVQSALGVTFGGAPSATLPAAGNTRLSYCAEDNVSSDVQMMTMSASTILAAGDTITVYRGGSWSTGAFTMSGAVFQL